MSVTNLYMLISGLLSVIYPPIFLLEHLFLSRFVLTLTVHFTEVFCYFPLWHWLAGSAVDLGTLKRPIIRRQDFKRCLMNCLCNCVFLINETVIILCRIIYLSEEISILLLIADQNSCQIFFRPDFVANTIS